MWILRLKRLRRSAELSTLAALLVVSGCAWGFVALAEEVFEGETHAFDSAVLLALRTPGQLDNPIGGPWLEEMARDFTALGSFGILTAVTVVVCGLLLLMGRARTMLFVAAAVSSGAVVSTLFKELFDRPRPELVPHEVLVTSASFPSGHSMLAAVTYLTLATLFSRVEARRAIKVYFIVVAVLVTVAVGVSRVYLGVHWPTDVLAGWTAGTAWALGCWLVARWLQRRGEIEPEVGEAGIVGMVPHAAVQRPGK